MPPAFALPVNGLEARLASRTNTLNIPTSGIAPGHLQANLIALPSRYAHDFELLCARNPVPIPLLARSAKPGDSSNFISYIPGISSTQLVKGIDIRTDAPQYNVYRDGKLTEEGVRDVKECWDEEDHVAFLVGCSYSFETALQKANLTPPHMLHGRNVTMYHTNIPLNPVGAFMTSNYVVSMRMYPSTSIPLIRSITRPYIATHGEPIAWGWDDMRRIGIEDVSLFDWGDAPVCPDGHVVVEEEAKEKGFVPVFWGCGVTPQEAIVKAGIGGIVIGHRPGYMVVLDVREEDVLVGERAGV